MLLSVLYPRLSVCLAVGDVDGDVEAGGDSEGPGETEAGEAAVLRDQLAAWWWAVAEAGPVRPVGGRQLDKLHRVGAHVHSCKSE